VGSAGSRVWVLILQVMTSHHLGATPSLAASVFSLYKTATLWY
jgi:hypothetical protein